MDIFNVAVGCGLLLVQIIIASQRRHFAKRIQAWFRLMSEPMTRPWWRRGHFQPNELLANLILAVFIMAMSILALSFIANGLHII
jgi:hypothetical protein